MLRLAKNVAFMLATVYLAWRTISGKSFNGIESIHELLIGPCRSFARFQFFSLRFLWHSDGFVNWLPNGVFCSPNTFYATEIILSRCKISKLLQRLFNRESRMARRGRWKKLIIIWWIRKSSRSQLERGSLLSHGRLQKREAKGKHQNTDKD